MLLPAVRHLHHLPEITGAPLYLVGGTVRDLLLGIEDIKDVDILLPSGSKEVARTFAERIGGSFFVLDEQRCITRVVKSEGSGLSQFDFTDFEGPDLATDLARRDFTVNAMALDLRAYITTGALEGVIDHFQGREDLERKSIRVANPRVLDEDPLRLLRAVRFSAVLGFDIAHRTRDEISLRATKVAEPSAERLRDELFIILGESGADHALLQMESLGLLSPLIPELDPLRGFAPGRYHVQDVLTHSIRTVGCLDEVLSDLPRLASAQSALLLEHLSDQLEQGVTRGAALRFACLVHDIAKYDTYSNVDGRVRFHGHDTLGGERVRSLCRRFRLSRNAEGIVGNVVRQHMRLFNLSAPGGPSRNALYRYCRDLGRELPESLLLAQSDARATAEIMQPEKFIDTEQTMLRVLEYYYTRFLRVERKPFVTGQDLIALNLEPGPRFRDILEEVKALQADGTLRDRTEALAYIRDLAS